MAQYTTDGRQVEVLSPGLHNTDAGPDFSMARIRIDGVELIGNVEIHISSSDWYRHHHDTDPAYDSIILHVVRFADRDILNTQGQPILQLPLQYPSEQDYVSGLLAQARNIDTAAYTHRCGSLLMQDPSLLTEDWKRQMLIRRLECKQQSIQRLLEITHGSWEEALYITLAHHFGFHINGIPFETLAVKTPLRILQKHRNSRFQMSAILLGQSGLLAEDDSDLGRDLQREYEFLRSKFSLEPMESFVWKRGRVRPQNAPQVRILQFAHLLHQSEFLFSHILDTHNLDNLRQLFTLRTPASPENDHGLPVSSIGRASIDTLLINVVVPFKYARHQQEEALALLDQLPREDNRVVRQWIDLGQKVSSSADSQALIHLYQTCCQSHRCINCDVVYRIFAK